MGLPSQCILHEGQVRDENSTVIFDDSDDDEIRVNAYCRFVSLSLT